MSGSRRVVMMARLLLLLCVYAPAVNNLWAQTSKPDVCAVDLVDYSAKNVEGHDELPFKRLGNFEPVVGEEELTVRSFRIPGTKLFAVAAVFYTDESMYIGGHYDSVSISVTISKSARRDPLRSLQYSEAEAMYAGPNAVRVYTLLRIRRRPFMVVMQCRHDADP